MIERYTRPAMGRIWTLENRYRAWLAVEVAVCEAWAELGRVPAEAVKTIREKADIDVDRILEIEQTTRHDVIAFLTSLEEKVGPDARYIHLGCTSSDIVDTANGYLFMQAGKLIVEDIEKVLASLEALARKHKGVLCMGRTHGIHAETRLTAAGNSKQFFDGWPATGVFHQIRTHNSESLYTIDDRFRINVLTQPAARHGNETFNVDLVGIKQKPDHGLGIIRFVLHVS